jgi:hypothetical protein
MRLRQFGTGDGSLPSRELDLTAVVVRLFSDDASRFVEHGRL